MKSVISVSTLVLFMSFNTEAKVFSFDSRSFGAYFRGSAASSQLHQDAFANSSGTTTQFNSTEVSYNYAGEFGFQLNTSSMNIRLGVEAIRPPETTITGTNTSGTALFELTSYLFVFSPTVTMEYLFFKRPTYNMYFSVAGQIAYASLSNNYVFTSSGNTAFSPITSYLEKATGNGTGWMTGLGIESMLADNATIAFDIGYRYLVIQTLNHIGSNSTLAQSSVTKGAGLLNHDGSSRQLNFSGPAVFLSLKFYIF